jgi:hypothetical protein
MKPYNIITILIAAVLVFSCKDFDELEQNQNRPTTAPASLVRNQVLNDLYERPWSLEHRQNQFWCCNYNYYGTNEYWASATKFFPMTENSGTFLSEHVTSALASGGNDAVNKHRAM